MWPDNKDVRSTRNSPATGGYRGAPPMGEREREREHDRPRKRTEADGIALDMTAEDRRSVQSQVSKRAVEFPSEKNSYGTTIPTPSHFFYFFCLFDSRWEREREREGEIYKRRCCRADWLNKERWRRPKLLAVRIELTFSKRGSG
jgi:hypothetical protein